MGLNYTLSKYASFKNFLFKSCLYNYSTLIFELVKSKENCKYHVCSTHLQIEKSIVKNTTNKSKTN